MAISPKISIKQSSTECGKVVLCDLTGEYSASNTGGYGFPNITQPGKITLTVTTPSGESGSDICRAPALCRYLPIKLPYHLENLVAPYL